MNYLGWGNSTKSSPRRADCGGRKGDVRVTCGRDLLANRRYRSPRDRFPPFPIFVVRFGGRQPSQPLFRPYPRIVPSIRTSLNGSTPKFNPFSTNDRVDSVQEFSPPTLSTIIASEPIQYDPTEPVSAPPASITDPGHVALRPTDVDAFLSFLDGGRCDPAQPRCKDQYGIM